MDLTEPFANLRKKNVEFIWSEEQQKAFDRLKVIMAKKPVVKIFDLKKDIMLTTDASEHSVSRILSQGHPVMYLSRRLTKTEFNYSYIEALAIVWTTSRSQQFLNGKKIFGEVFIDHYSLYSIQEKNYQKSRHREY